MYLFNDSSQSTVLHIAGYKVNRSLKLYGKQETIMEGKEGGTLRMSRIEIRMNFVNSTTPTLRSLSSSVSGVKRNTSSLRWGMDSRITSRRNIGQRLNQVTSSLTKLENQLKDMEMFVKHSMNKYTMADRFVNSKVYSIDGIQKENPYLSSLKKVAQEIQRTSESIKDYMARVDKFLLGAHTLGVFLALGMTRDLTVNYMGGRKPSLWQRVTGKYKFTVTASSAWTSKGNYSNRVASAIHNFSKSTPTNAFAQKAHKFVNSYSSPSAMLKHAAGFSKNVHGQMLGSTLVERTAVRVNTPTAAAAKSAGITNAGRAIPMIGTALIPIVNTKELFNSNNTHTENIGRFVTSTGFDFASAGAGAKIGMKIGAIGGPKGVIIGGAVGAVAGTIAASPIKDKVVDFGGKTVSFVSDKAKSVGNKISGWFS